MFITILNAIIALPKIIGFADKIIDMVRAWLREQDRKKEEQRTKSDDAAVNEAIAKAQSGVQNINNLWGD
jgi:hypothetical protein